MPKQKTDKPLTDKQKIRMLEQDIKEMQRDFKETFSVFDEPKKKRSSKLWIFLVLVLILAAAAYIYVNYFI
ncbi:MAG: hypothetical protein IJZ61_02745 [Oscillospiraceae bacterium]|nr:hypothetical protein [Oscillospiraceae bacterium]